MGESARIVKQCADLLGEWPEDEHTIQANVPRTIRPDPDAEVYRAVEAAKGELGSLDTRVVVIDSHT